MIKKNCKLIKIILSILKIDIINNKNYIVNIYL